MFPAPSALVSTFQQEIYHHVEYSYGPQESQFGSMIGGWNENFLCRVQNCFQGFPYAAEWVRALDTFQCFCRASVWYLKIDWYCGQIERLSIYFRLFEPPPLAELMYALKKTAPFDWSGPSIDTLAEALNVHGPGMIGFRVAINGRFSVSLYYLMQSLHEQLNDRWLRALLSVLAIPQELMSQIQNESRPLLSGIYPGWVGVECPCDDPRATLKIDATQVELRKGLDALSNRGVSDARRAELVRVAQCLRADYFAYISGKYSSYMPPDWKVYLGHRPTNRMSSGLHFSYS